MILLGQTDSPFVRRVAVALHHYGRSFRREVRSVFADFDAVLEINPLGKVPALLLDGGVWLFESRAILEHLDAEAPPGLALTPADPGMRAAMLRVEAVAIGLTEKTYERGLEFSRRAEGRHDPAMVARFERQIGSALAWLERHIGAHFAVGDRLSRADLALTCALTYLRAKLPALYGPDEQPRLENARQRMEAMPPFAAAPFSEAEARATGWRPEAADPE
ncbi:MAG: glutathione S-transferase family protein [Pseudomonadota bacterium]